MFGSALRSASRRFGAAASPHVSHRLAEPVTPFSRGVVADYDPLASRGRPHHHHPSSFASSRDASLPRSSFHRGYAAKRASPRGGHRRPSRPPPAAKSASALRPVSASWTEVRDPRGGPSYWWNRDTNQTTGVGEPRPTTYRLPPRDAATGTGGGALTRPYDERGEPTLGLKMGQMVVFGFGGALGVMFVSGVVAMISRGAGAEGRTRADAEEEKAAGNRYANRCANRNGLASCE